ncbi:MAG TPA: sulfite exporter TauE/SafE family protein [Streptosporangiaceae bacterium]
MTLSTLAVAALLVGVLIGMVGIGGVVLPPALILIGGVEPHRATAISLISFTLTGVVSAALQLRAGAVPRSLTRNLAIGLLPGALAGGWLSARIPQGIILGGLAAICLGSALWAVARGRAAAAARPGREDIGAAVAAPIGVVVGLGSALTGTSGPVLLTPALMMARLAIGQAIIVGQVIQVIVTPAGALGSVLRARPELGLTAVLAAATAAGTVLGIAGTRRLRPPETVLRRVVAGLLAATGILVALRLAA